MRTGNPTLRDSTFNRTLAAPGEAVMTINGTVHRCFILFFLLLVSATFTWTRFFETGTVESVAPLMVVGLFGGLITALVVVFKKTTAPYLAPVYALLEGLLLGGLSAMFETAYPGIVMQAVALTMGTLFSLLVAYKTGAIKVTENFKLGVFAATGGIALVYLVSFGMRMFGLEMPFIHDSGMIGIGISLFIVVVAALNLVLDFDFIESGAEQGAPKYMEWYGAFGLMVTLVWLYLEILRLLGKMRN